MSEKYYEVEFVVIHRLRVSAGSPRKAETAGREKLAARLDGSESVLQAYPVEAAKKEVEREAARAQLAQARAAFKTAGKPIPTWVGETEARLGL